MDVVAKYSTLMCSMVISMNLIFELYFLNIGWHLRELICTNVLCYRSLVKTTHDVLRPEPKAIKKNSSALDTKENSLINNKQRLVTVLHKTSS